MSRKLVENALLQAANTIAGRAYPVRAPAKLNLRLRVTGRRDDGYHLLEMLNCTAALYDEVCIWFEPNGRYELTTEPETAETGPDADNLVLRAAAEFWHAFEISGVPVGMRIHLTKRIPVGAGLGGGSSDAAAVLRVMSGCFGAAIRESSQLAPREFESRVLAAALRCGADVPYAYAGGVCIVRGVGELVTPIDRADIWPGAVLVVCPPVAVNTRQFYDFFRQHVSAESFAPPDESLVHRVGETADIASFVQNDFEPWVCRCVPGVKPYLDILQRSCPKGAALTGSGSAMFALIRDPRANWVTALESELKEAGATLVWTTLSL